MAKPYSRDLRERGCSSPRRTAGLEPEVLVCSPNLRECRPFLPRNVRQRGTGPFRHSRLREAYSETLAALIR
jgi:hypothetical protein